MVVDWIAKSRNIFVKTLKEKCSLTATNLVSLKKDIFLIAVLNDLACSHSCLTLYQMQILQEQHITPHWCNLGCFILISTTFFNNSKMAAGMSSPESAPESPVTTRQYGVPEWAGFRNRGFCFALSQTCFSLTECTTGHLICQLITLTRNILASATSQNALFFPLHSFLDKYILNLESVRGKRSNLGFFIWWGICISICMWGCLHSVFRIFQQVWSNSKQLKFITVLGFPLYWLVLDLYYGSRYN